MLNSTLNVQEPDLTRQDIVGHEPRLLSWGELGESSSPGAAATSSPLTLVWGRLLPIRLAHRAAHSAGHAECDKAVGDLPAPINEQANCERSDKRTESANPHSPTKSSGTNGRGVQQGSQRDQAGARDTEKEAGEPQEHNNKCDGLSGVAHCAEGRGAAHQSDWQNAPSREATHQKPSQRRSENTT